MLASYRDKWINALRSGQYRQGTHALRRKGLDGVMCYCGLGVLADVAAPGAWIEVESGVYAYRRKTLTFAVTLPPSFLDEVRLDVQQAVTVQVMNDAIGADFNRIADWVEANVPAE